MFGRTTRLVAQAAITILVLFLFWGLLSPSVTPAFNLHNLIPCRIVLVPLAP